MEITDPDETIPDFTYVTCDVDITVDEKKWPKSRSKRRGRGRKQSLTQREQKSDNNDDEEDDEAKREPSTALESSAGEVLERFARGCECQETCFKGLNADSVYRHRLNIAELTKEEHHMYLMGVSMASLANPIETSRHKERVRQRASYVYHGKRVCLDAFLYLENVTHYQLKRVRSHVMANGVVPRVHGNVRKKPHNTFSLDIYKCAENFLKTTLNQYTSDASKHCFIVNESRTSIYEKFKQNIPPGGKIMGYTTFRHFLKKQFPHVRFSFKPSDHSRDGSHRKSVARTYSKSGGGKMKSEPSTSRTMKMMVEVATEPAGEVACDEDKGGHSAIDTETSFTEVDDDDEGGEEEDEEAHEGDCSIQDGQEILEYVVE